MKRLSIIIVTRNRCDALRRTIGQFARHVGLPCDSYEIIVIDNASDDGTHAMLRTIEDVDVHCIRRPSNEGATARNHGLSVATGEYILFLDDDSFPIGDAVPRALAYLDLHADVAAVVPRIELPDGTAEASALPGVVICCGFFVRRSVLDEVGAFPIEFVRQAEEYDLSFRIWDAGHAIVRFEDLVIRHEKSSTNRVAADILRFDMRNNLALVDRYLPKHVKMAYRQDWIQRYQTLARHAGCEAAAQRGRVEARVWRSQYPNRLDQELTKDAFENLFEFDRQARLVEQWARSNRIRRVAIADLSKNIYATWRACQRNGLEIKGIVDAHPAFAGLEYRGLAVSREPDGHVDGFVLSNVNPARVDSRLDQLGRQFAGPVLRLWIAHQCPTRLAPDARTLRPPDQSNADDGQAAPHAAAKAVRESAA